MTNEECRKYGKCLVTYDTSNIFSRVNDGALSLKHLWYPVIVVALSRPRRCRAIYRVIYGLVNVIPEDLPLSLPPPRFKEPLAKLLNEEQHSNIKKDIIKQEKEVLESDPWKCLD